VYLAGGCGRWMVGWCGNSGVMIARGSELSREPRQKLDLVTPELS
jgi:hypothetical protein